MKRIRTTTASLYLLALGLATLTVPQSHAAAIGAPVKPMPQPLAPDKVRPGPYVLRYLESEPDDHLDLRIRVAAGTILLSDVAPANLQGCTYTINGWTDPDDCSRLVDEPIKPYTLYHVTKASVAAPFREWWRTMPEIQKDNPITCRRGEAFFVVVPKNERWNGAGTGFNPIGRPLAFSDLPGFTLTNRIYGFDAGFPDESDKRLDELSITFNRIPGRKHLMLYSSALEQFLKSKGYDQEPRRPVEEWTEQDCIDYADSLPSEAILAFDVEPPEGWHWVINYSHPDYTRNIARVVARLAERGITAYDWMHSPDFFYNDQSIRGYALWGNGNNQMDLFLEAYAHPDQIRRAPAPNPVINVGFGYDPYDYSYLPDDGEKQNSSPQALYLKALDACELARRVYPDKELIAFVWPFIESQVGTFPRNHVVDVPGLGNGARRIDNKPIYAPSSWQDSMTLALLYCRYLYYWAGGSSWNPTNVARYAQPNARPGEMVVWEFTNGPAPQLEGAPAAYAGKELMSFNATIAAAYRYAQLQSLCDTGTRRSAATQWRRADRKGQTAEAREYPAYPDGSWFVRAAKERQPFTLIVTHPGSRKKIVFFQDVWSRPGRWTEFSFEFAGKVYNRANTPSGKTVPLRTDGNRLFIGVFE